MTRTLFASAAAALLVLAAPASAAEEDARTFTRDGITYTYTKTQTEAGIVLEGTAEPFGGKFRFVVRNGKVTGYAGGVRVAFLVEDALKARKIYKIAAR